jgi:hypothetical protein
MPRELQRVASGAFVRCAKSIRILDRTRRSRSRLVPKTFAAPPVGAPMLSWLGANGATRLRFHPPSCDETGRSFSNPFAPGLTQVNQSEESSIPLSDRGQTEFFYLNQIQN